MSERIDEIEKYYVSIEKNDKWLWSLFLVSAFFSIAILYSSNIQPNWIHPLLKVLFISIVVIYSILSLYSNLYLIPRAEKYRRKQLLSNSFGVSLTSEKTEKYYNNEFSPSINRLGMSILENSFFAKNVCNMMLKKERLKVFIYFIVWILAVSYRNTELDLILILTQIFFSGEILVSLIKLEILRFQNESIYNDLYAHYFHNISPTSSKGIANILDLFASYEVAKANASLKQSSKIFDELNPKLSAEWEEIRKKVLKIEHLEGKRKKKKERR